MKLPQASRTSCRNAHPLAGGDTGGPAKPVPRCPTNWQCQFHAMRVALGAMEN